MPPSYVQTIMLVDDDKDALDCLRELLVARGYAVAEARDGEQALDYLRHNPHPCLILLDLMMPRMNGWEFLTHKAQDDKLAAVPVVITSGTEENVPTHVAGIMSELTRQARLGPAQRAGRLVHLAGAKISEARKGNAVHCGPRRQPLRLRRLTNLTLSRG